jgi:ferrochelatase
VVYDLDTEARALCQELGVNLHRAGTAGVHPAFVSMIRDLILEGAEGCRACAADCCAPPRRPGGGPPVRSAEAR